MNKVLKVAIAGAVAMVLGNSVVFAQEAQSGKAQNSASGGKGLQAAQKALAAGKYQDVLAELDKVKADPKKNEYDEYIMNQFYVSTYLALKKNQDAEGALEAVINSKYLPPAELKKRVVTAVTLNNQLENYDKVLQFGTRAVKDGYATPAVDLVMAQAYYQKKDYRNTDKFVRGLVDEQIKAGQAPSETLLQLGQSSAMKLNDNVGEAHWFELLVTYHPKPEYWLNLMTDMYHSKLDDHQLLEVHRLAADVGALNRDREYAELAQLSLDAGAAGESVAVLNKAFAANVFTQQADKNRNTHLLETAKKQAAADQAGLPKAEADAAAAPNGDKLIAVGSEYYGFGDYAKAAKNLQSGIAKGASKDAANAQLLLGISQLKAGDKAGAAKSFKAVKGDPVMERLAQLWTLHARA